MTLRAQQVYEGYAAGMLKSEDTSRKLVLAGVHSLVNQQHYLDVAGAERMAFNDSFIWAMKLDLSM